MMTDPCLYAVGYDVGFEDGFKEAQGRIKELDARINELEADNSYFRQAARYASDWEAAADKLRKEVVSENKQLRQKLNEVTAHHAVTAAHFQEYMGGNQAAEAKLVFASKMLPRAIIALLKDRKQEAIDVIETVIEELKGDSDG